MKQNIKTLGINHFGLSVAKLEESIDFYQEVFNLKLKTKRKCDAFFLLDNGGVFALIQYPYGEEAFNKEMRPKKKGKLFTHFGFQAESTEDVFAFEGFLKKKKIPIIKNAYSRWDGASVYFSDPNDYTIEFIFFDPNAKP